MNYKTVTQFKAGDIVHYNGSRFLIRNDAAEAILYRPQAGHLEAAAGPSPMASAIGDWLDGEFRGFVGHEKYWIFQGSHAAGKYRIDN